MMQEGRKELMEERDIERKRKLEQTKLERIKASEELSK